jgi:hypothetical protein
MAAAFQFAGALWRGAARRFLFSGISLGFSIVFIWFSMAIRTQRNRREAQRNPRETPRETPEKPRRNPEKPRETQRNPEKPQRTRREKHQEKQSQRERKGFPPAPDFTPARSRHLFSAS